MKLQNISNGNPFVIALYTYDNMSRLATISNGNITANYARIPGSSMLKSTTINNGSEVTLTTTKTYDNLNRLTTISHSGNAELQLGSFSYIYIYNDRDQRTIPNEFSINGLIDNSATVKIISQSANKIKQATITGNYFSQKIVLSYNLKYRSTISILL